MQRYCIQDKKSPNFQDIRSPIHETPSLLPRHVNKDATSVNNFTNKNLANSRQQVLFLVLFHTNILLYLHFCSRKHCHPFLYSLNSYFFNLFLIFICALTFFCNELLFSVEAVGCYPQSQEFLDNLSPIILLGFVCVQKPKLLDSIQRKR